MPKLSPLMLAPPLIFAGFVALAAVGMFRDDPDSLPSTFVGQQAPALPAEVLEGFPAATQEMLTSGEVTLVNFWASWCPPCRAEHPKLLEWAAEGLPIVGVNMRDTQANASKYLIDDENPFVGVGFDTMGRTSIDWGVTAPPETFIVDGEGTVLYRFAGPLVGSALEQRFMPELEKALAENGG